MAFKNGFEVKPLAGGDYELIPTQMLFAVSKSEESLWELAGRISTMVEEFNATEWTPGG